MGQKPRGAERGTLSASCNGAERGTECYCGSLRSGSLAHGAERGPIGQARGELWILRSLRMGPRPRVRMGLKPRGAERGTLSASCNGAERGTECDCGSLTHGAKRGPIG